MTKKEFIQIWSKEVHEGNVKQTFVIDHSEEFEKYLNDVIRDELIGFAYFVHVTKQSFNGCDTGEGIDTGITEIVDTYLNKQK